MDIAKAFAFFAVNSRLVSVVWSEVIIDEDVWRLLLDPWKEGNAQTTVFQWKVC